MIARELDEALSDLAEEADEEVGLVQVALKILVARSRLRDGSDGISAAIATLETRVAALDVAEHPDTIPVELGEAARDARDLYLRAIALLRDHAAKEAA